MNEQADHTPAWIDWLKKPENLMTGIVLAAGLMQDRQQGQSKWAHLGQKGLGALAFRGGLTYGQQQNQLQQDEAASQQGYRRGQLDLQQQQINTTKSEGAANRQAAAANTDKTIAGQIDLRKTPQGMSPEEQALANAQAKQATSLAGYYDRMPFGVAGGGKGPDDALGGDLYEQEMFKQWTAAEMSNAQMSGQPFVMDPMKWATFIQPYRNAKIVLKQMEAGGLPGEVYKDDKGQWRVRLAGVATPSGPDAPPGGNPPPVELNPSSIEGAAAAATTRKTEETKAAAAAAERARPASPEEMKPFIDKLPALSNAELEDLMKSKDLPIEQLRVIRTELRRRSDAVRAEKGARSQVSGLR